MINNPLISVITPVYNREKYITESIDSILNQTYQNFELILIDDCSTDRTNEILNNFLKKDSRVKLLKNKKNIGPTNSFNKGLLISKGEYIAKMDSDDISIKNRFEKQIDFFNKCINLDVLGTGAIIIDETGKELDRKKFPPDYKSIKKRIIKTSPVFDPSVMIKSHVLKEVGSFDDRLAPADDFHLWLSLFKKKKIISNLNDYLIKYRMHDENLTKINRKEQIAKTILSKKIHFSNLSTDEFFQKKIENIYTDLEKLIIHGFKRESTDTDIDVKILKEYLKSGNYQDNSNDNFILWSIYNLFLNNSYPKSIFYFTRFLFSKLKNLK
jgi:glycosyltransferase involved in cell wall biosynthesis